MFTIHTYDQKVGVGVQVDLKEIERPDRAIDFTSSSVQNEHIQEERRSSKCSQCSYDRGKDSFSYPHNLYL